MIQRRQSSFEQPESSFLSRVLEQQTSEMLLSHSELLISKRHLPNLIPEFATIDCFQYSLALDCSTDVLKYVCSASLMHGSWSVIMHGSSNAHVPIRDHGFNAGTVAFEALEDFVISHAQLRAGQKECDNRNTSFAVLCHIQCPWSFLVSPVFSIEQEETGWFWICEDEKLSRF